MQNNKFNFDFSNWFPTAVHPAARDQHSATSLNVAAPAPMRTLPEHWHCGQATPCCRSGACLSFAGTPTILEDIWLPAAAFKGLTAERLANYNGPTYALFETEFNVRMVRAEERLRAEPAANGIEDTRLK